MGIKKRFQVTGLKNGIIRVYPQDDVTVQTFHAYVNSDYPWKTGQFPFALGDEKLGKYFLIENVTGNLVVSW